MEEPNRIAVTGVSGTLGSLIAERVADLDPVVLVRDPARAPAWTEDVRVCDYADRSAATAALADVHVLMNAARLHPLMT